MKFACGICLITEDVIRLSRFYQRLLNVSCDLNDIHAVIPVGNARLVIYAKSAAEKDMGFDFRKHNGTGRVEFTLLVENVDKEYGRLQALNIDFAALPKTYPWGSRSMHVRDLDGNLICFLETGGEG